MDVKFKGSKIKLKGITAAQNKAVAKEGDQVVGVDIHQVKVPAGNTTVDVPLPHPYVGKLDGSLSQDVSLDNKGVAHKGSKCNHVSPGHIFTPPGIAWSGAAPSNKGEITNGTVPTVKVNNKEIAVLGSMVKTCNFPNDTETCTVVAVGAAVKVPMVIPGLPMDQFTKDKGSVINTRDLVSQRSPSNPPPTPQITSVQWGAGRAKAGEEVTLTANLSNQYPNAAVYFEIFKEGDEKPFMKRAVTMKDNKGELTLVFNDPRRDAEVDEIKYKAKAGSFKCDPVESSEITIEKVKPEFSELKWKWINPEDKSENEIDKAEVKVKVLVTANVENIEDGKLVKVSIYDTQIRTENLYVEQKLVEVIEGKISHEWKVECSQKRLEELTENDELKYIFVLEAYNVKSDDSPELQTLFSWNLRLTIDKEVLERTDEIILKTMDGSTYSQARKVQEDLLGEDNFIIFHYTELIPGHDYKLEQKDGETGETVTITENLKFIDMMR